ncbi:toll/interleukin-1 receptor domain-containing protein [Mesorhizobium sp. M0309]|uniref:toll-Interleukin receptor n=1 Tax=Mesorhizobium sp. M0309 TaxID=2956933 RepID=UPI00333DE6F4
MPLITEDQLRKIARDAKGQRTASIVLKEEIAGSSSKTSFDIFLSHSIKDAEIVLGVKKLFEKLGATVYVDWVEDPQLDRSKVTAITAELLRMRMKQSNSLLFLHSNNSPGSRWMPWELGFFDGYRGVIAVLPVAKTENETFVGQEFLGLYPYIDGSPAVFWVNQGNALRSRLGSLEAGKNFKEAKSWLRDMAGMK